MVSTCICNRMRNPEIRVVQLTFFLIHDLNYEFSTVFLCLVIDFSWKFSRVLKKNLVRVVFYNSNLALLE